MLDEDFLEHLHTLLYLLLGVSGHQSETHERVLRCTGRWNDRIDEDTIVERQFGDDEGLVDIPDIEWDDGTLGVANLESLLAEALEGIVGGFPEFLPSLGLSADDMQCLAGCSGGSGRIGCAEDILAEGLTELLDVF